MAFKGLAVATGSGDFLKLQDGDNKARIVSTEPIQVFTIWEDGKPRHFSSEASMSAGMASAGASATKKTTYAVYVIDRKDGSCKIAQFGSKIASDLQELEDDSEYGFDGAYPYDINIKKAGTGLETKYTVTPARSNSTLTVEEQAMVAALAPLKEKLADTFEDKEALPF